MGWILIVEDDEEIASSLDDVLGDAGYECVIAHNGREGLEALHERPDPDAIVLDLMMPVMNGLEFRRAQLANPALRDIPLVVMSASGIDEVAGEFKTVPHLRKPFQVNWLLQVLARVVKSDPCGSKHEHLVHF